MLLAGRNRIPPLLLAAIFLPAILRAADTDSSALSVRASGMGGADIAAKGRHLSTNPAALGSVDRPSAMGQVVVGRQEQDGGADTHREDASAIIPLPVCVGVAEIHAAFLEEDSEDPQDGEADARFVRLRYGKAFSRAVSLGASFSYENRNEMPRSGAKVDRDHCGLELGLRWQASDALAIGLVAGYEWQEWDGRWSRESFDGPFPAPSLHLDGDAGENNAYRIGGGVEFTPNDSLTFTGDLRYFRESSDTRYAVLYDAFRIYEVRGMDEAADRISFRVGVEKSFRLCGCGDERRFFLRAGYRLDRWDGRDAGSDASEADETLHTGAMGAGVRLGRFSADLSAEVSEQETWTAGAAMGFGF